MPEPEIDYQKQITRFLASHPRYKPTERNKLLLLEFLDDHDLDLDSVSIAYTNLAAADKLDLEDPEEPPVVAPRRREFVAFRNGRPISGDVRPL
jgi:hypothetical protein